MAFQINSLTITTILLLAPFFLGIFFVDAAPLKEPEVDGIADGQIAEVEQAIAKFVLAISGLLLFPKTPDFSPRLMRTKNFAENGVKVTTDPQNQFNFTISLEINMRVYNPNIYRLVVNKLDLRTALQPNASALAGSGLPGTDKIDKNSILPSTNVGFGETGRLTFESKSETNFTFDITINLDSNDFLVNPYLRAEIEQVCTSQDNKRHFTFTYVITLRYEAFRYTPTITSTSNVRCPLDRHQLERLMNLLPSS